MKKQTPEPLPILKVGQKIGDKEDKWELVEELGKGMEGIIFKARRGEKVAALKMGSNNSTLFYEVHIYNLVGKIEGIADIYESGIDAETKIKYIAMKLMDKTISQLLKENGNSFNLNTVCSLGLKMITVLEGFHGKEFVYHDIAPGNFMCGFGVEAEKIFLIDLGVAKKASSLVITGFNGTPLFASRKSLQGYSATYNDDMEALGFMLAFLHKGVLPWSDPNAQMKTQKQFATLGKTKEKYLPELIREMPEPLKSYITYSTNLQDDEKFNYEFAKSLFRDTLQLNPNYQLPWVKLIPASIEAKESKTTKIATSTDSSLHSKKQKRSIESPKKQKGIVEKKKKHKKETKDETSSIKIRKSPRKKSKPDRLTITW